MPSWLESQYLGTEDRLDKLGSERYADGPRSSQNTIQHRLLAE